MRRRVSYAQNAEDVRVWRAFADVAGPLTYVDVGANEPRTLSITASLYDEGWRGVLIEADPGLAAALRVHRPEDAVVEAAAAQAPGRLTFHRVAGTGLGTLGDEEAAAAAARGFAVDEVSVAAVTLDEVLDRYAATTGRGEVHFMSVDVEGAEAQALAGLSLSRHRPWVLCVEAVLPGTGIASHDAWEPRLLEAGYELAAFDGVNRWYVADEHAELLESISIPFNARDAGEYGWVIADLEREHQRANRAGVRRAWQRELLLHDLETAVPREEYERQIVELRGALVQVEGSRTFKLSRKLSSPAKVVWRWLHRLPALLPGPIRRRIIAERHLRHVNANLVHLTAPAFLAPDTAVEVRWSNPKLEISVPAISLGALEGAELAATGSWLASGPHDGDALLEVRMDNLDDELGRTMSALRTRVRIAQGSRRSGTPSGGRILVDARALQNPAFASRGIGLFAVAALRAARDEAGDDRVTLLVDSGQLPLPAELAGSCEQIVRVHSSQAGSFGMLIEPSPMTASPDPFLDVLLSGAHKLAVVFDFIPMHYEAVYLHSPAARAEYASRLDALRCYDSYLCISQVVRDELTKVLGRTPNSAVVAWPRDLVTGANAAYRDGGGPIVVATGDEARKNTFGALAGIGAATSGDAHREVVVVGMAGQPDRVHHWSIAAAMRPGEAATAGRLSPDELGDLLGRAELVVVASFDEGLSLPVIEAVAAGTPVVASDIPAHRELVGAGGFLAPAGSPRALAKAVRRHRGRRATWARQARRLARHGHALVEEVVAQQVRAIPTGGPALTAAVHAAGAEPRVAMATPWAPQKSGVADFSTAVGRELAGLCRLTVLTTSGADVQSAAQISHARLADALADPRGLEEFDAVVSVLGNSHYHLPHLQLLDVVDVTVISHDTRFVEFYAALRGQGGVEQVMLRTLDGAKRIHPPFSEQIEDMRLLQNLGFWEIARKARTLLVHTPTAVPLIAEQTGVTPVVMPFANYRAPSGGQVSDQHRAAARARLGFDEHPAGTIHLATFGYVDNRTKQCDVVLEAAGWLSRWGRPVSLHMVGSASAPEREALERRAAELGLLDFRITGYTSDDEYRDYLLAIDLGLQLRISPYLGVAGALSDLAAHGTPALGSRGVCADVDTPDFIDRLPDASSPVTLAEAIEYRLRNPQAPEVIEAQRVDYLDRKSPRRYAELLLAHLAGGA